MRLQGAPGLASPVTFHDLSSLSGELEVHDLSSDQWNDPVFPRFIKTHNFDRLKPSPSCRLIYVIRDPRDVMLSGFSYYSKKRKKVFEGTLDDFCADREFGIWAYNRHIVKHIDRVDLVLRYEDLIRDPVVQLRRVFDLCDLPFELDTAKIAAERSNPQFVRGIEETHSRPGQAENFSADFFFVRDGRLDQWRSNMSDQLADWIWQHTSPELKTYYDGQSP